MLEEGRLLLNSQQPGIGRCNKVGVVKYETTVLREQEDSACTIEDDFENICKSSTDRMGACLSVCVSGFSMCVCLGLACVCVCV